LQAPLEYVSSTETTADLIGSVLPCGTLVHRKCFEKCNAEGAEYVVCPHCRVAGSRLHRTDPAISIQMWRDGQRPPCLCKEKAHASRNEYDTCPFRPSQCGECLEIMPLNQLHAHHAECMKKSGTSSVKCPNAGCIAVLNPRSNELHAIVCPKRKVRCVCKKEMAYEEFQLHIKGICKKRVRKCEFCNTLRSLDGALAEITHKQDVACPVRRLVHMSLDQPTKMHDHLAKADAAAAAAPGYENIPN
jgi:hypothetical protein